MKAIFNLACLLVEFSPCLWTSVLAAFSREKPAPVLWLPVSQEATQTLVPTYSHAFAFTCHQWSHVVTESPDHQLLSTGSLQCGHCKLACRGARTGHVWQHSAVMSLHI